MAGSAHCAAVDDAQLIRLASPSVLNLAGLPDNARKQVIHV
jgi:hypothetical protein